jgi:predicted CoA-binding protein
MILSTPDQRRALLERSKTVAMVGASDNEQRPSHGVFAYLRAHGYDVTPVNPAVEEIHGVKAVATLRDYATDRGAPDIVDVFRKPADVVPIVKDAIAIGAKAVWFQLGIVNQEAIDLANAAGLDVVVDHCMKIEHRALIGTQ